MRRKTTTKVLAILGLFFVLLAISCGSGESELVKTIPAAGVETGRALVLGDVSSDPAGTIADFQPMADYLAAQLAESGIQRGEVVVAPDLITMAEYLESGRVDLYFDSAYPSLSVYNAVGAQLLLRRWKKETGAFHTLIVTNVDSGIKNLDGLLGKSIAFDDRVSTSGHLLPKAHLTQLGYHLEEINSPIANISSEDIGYVFANGKKTLSTGHYKGRPLLAQYAI